MSSILDDLKNDVEGIEDRILGPSYSYGAKIPSPSDLGVSTNGDLGTTMNNVTAGITYAEYLMTGPNLGNKYFLATGAQCTPTDNPSTQADRYKYLDQSSDQPLFSGALQQDIGHMVQGDLNGLLPGILIGLEDLNPVPLLKSLVADAFPPCQKVTCPTGDVAGNLTNQTRYVLQSEVQDLTDNYGCTQSDQDPLTEPFENKQSQSITPQSIALIGFPILILVMMSLMK